MVLTLKNMVKMVGVFGYNDRDAPRTATPMRRRSCARECWDEYCVVGSDDGGDHSNKIMNSLTPVS
jgi:hypothetical protein